MTKQPASLALILHAHLPFVRHPESTEVIEERWLFEAITECYVPLLRTYLSLLDDDVPFCMTMSFTPTLLAMLSDTLLQQRYQHYLQSRIDLAQHEIARTTDDPNFAPLSAHYHDQFQQIKTFMDNCEWNLIPVIRAIADTGCLELITSAATHAFLPLLSTAEGVRAQIGTALSEHERHFGSRPRGIWLPECAYAPEIDDVLAAFGFDFFVTDTHGLLSADPCPRYGTHQPVLTPHGIAAFGRNAQASKQVWSQSEGYPGDYDYREYYRDIGFDLDVDWVRPYIGPNDLRLNTGIKYYRVTGSSHDKQPYRLDWASQKVKSHAGHFAATLARVGQESGIVDRSPVILAPYDAELFGHWWYEGPQFLNALFRELQHHDDEIQACTPSEYLSRYETYQVCRLPFTTWGRDGYADVWLQPANDWLYPVLHDLEEQMVVVANRLSPYEPLQERALNQAARELMLAQASDWAFIMDHATVVEYATHRVKQHAQRCQILLTMVQTDTLDESLVNEMEQLDLLFPTATYRAYRRPDWRPPSVSTNRPPCVLMLSWEFPPLTVGGLSRHVFDLGRYLTKHGWQVHVLTTEAVGSPSEDVIEGVIVHRIHIGEPDGQEFVHWAFQMNVAFLDAAHSLRDAGVHWDIVHAHDWMVCYAAMTLKHQYGLPLLATIHATEHGRNNGIQTQLQHYIHHQEWVLTYEAERVIICSRYMLEEVKRLFQLPGDKIDLIPNGVDLRTMLTRNEASFHGDASPSEPLILFVGRLVREKGVDSLIQAAPAILAACPDARFVIAGRGPMLEEWQALTEQLNVAHRFSFPGFISDDERNRLLATASVAVFPSYYEPFGIVALEAMAAGAPVVVSDVGGLRDVVEHGHNGLCAYPGDAASLATQITALLCDPLLADSVARTATRELRRYDWSTIAEQTIDSYREVLHVHTANHQFEKGGIHA